jgi:uncharacterized tellurite resistance protein B-like protein
MKESHYLSVIRVWAALAWADGVVVDAEAEALRRLIERAPQLQPEEREQALGFLDHRVELDVGALAGLARETRAGIYRSAVQLAAIDQDFADSERHFLERLREGLGMSVAEAGALETGVSLG